MLTVQQQFQFLQPTATSIRMTNGGLQLKCHNDLTVYFTMSLTTSNIIYSASYYNGKNHFQTNVTFVDINSSNLFKLASYMREMEQLQ